MSDPSENHAPQSVDLRQALHVIRDRKWVIIAMTLLGFGVGLLVSMLTTPQYQAKAQILRQNTTLDSALFDVQIFQISDQARALTTGADLVKLDLVAERVKEELGSSRSAQSLQGLVAVQPRSSSNIIDIVVTSPYPEEPAAVANSFARQFILYRQEADRMVLADAKAQMEAKLDAMTAEEAASARGQTLSQKVEELAVLESMQTGGYEMVQTARAPAAAYNVHTYRNAAVGLVLGFVLGLIVASLLQVLDRRIRDDDAFEKEFGVPVIARVPLVGSRWGGRGGRRSRAPVGFADRGSAALEAFRTLRSNLRFFEVDRELRTVLVTSPLPREGKSVTSINLALSLAISGSRVILLEADLRRPMLDAYLGLQSRVGLTDLLSGKHSINQVAQAVETDRFLPKDKRTFQASGSTREPQSRRDLLYVAAGPLPPNPAELLATDKMADVLRELSAVADHVIIDAPPILLVSDALEIAKRADGVILVSRMQATRIDEARRTRQSLERIGVKPLGVVVSGVTKAKAYYRHYGEYYAKT